MNASRYSHMVQEYYVARVRQARARRAERMARVKTRRDALKLQRECRQKIRRAFGRFGRRTALNARVTGVIDHPRYTLEKVLFESRPGLIVSAAVYVPKGLSGPAPAILAPCGHSDTGKAADGYQAFAQSLAVKGFVVLSYDPIGQAERTQYVDARGGQILSCTREHNMIGHQQMLCGDFFGAWRAWDGIRALDYLLARPEVDHRRVGVTGISGGGTMTTFLAGLDERITMAAPGCFVTTFLANMENELPADAEQCPPGILAAGLDECDFFIPFAPRPLVLLAQAGDYFDVRGTAEACRRLKRFYGLLGAAGNVRLFVGPGGHGAAPLIRREMYRFFCRHGRVKATDTEPRLTLRAPAEMAAARGGAVRNEGSKLVLDFTRQRAELLAGRRGRVARGRLPGVVKRLLALPRRPRRPHHRILRPFAQGKLHCHRFAVETEPGIQAIVTMPFERGSLFGIPPGKRCTLLVPHLSAVEDLSAAGLRRPLAGGGQVFAVDPRGIGESMSAACRNRDFAELYGCDYFYHAHGLMLGQPYVGRRVHDVLCTMDSLAGAGYERIRLVGRGLGAVTALLAATVDRRSVRVTLVNALLSYHELTQVPIYAWPASSMVPHALKKFDLPDCLRALGRKLTLIAPWDAAQKPIPAARARRRVAGLGLARSVLAAR